MRITTYDSLTEKCNHVNSKGVGAVSCVTESNPAREHRRPVVNPARGVDLGELLPHGKIMKSGRWSVFVRFIHKTNYMGMMRK